MFGSIAPTPYDLNFSLLRIPVRVHPLFWLMAAVLGWGSTMGDGRPGPAYLLIFIACMFLSVLVHEFGHALTARAFGYDPDVVLYMMGGFAMYRPDRRLTVWRSVAITAAGPLAGFALAGIAYVSGIAITRSGFVPDPHLGAAIIWLVWINILLNVFNLIPVIPLDGGQIVKTLLVHFRGGQGEEWAIKLSIVVAAIVAVAGLFVLHQTMIGIMFAMLAAMNIQALQARGHGGGYY